MKLQFRIDCIPPKSTGNSSRKIIRYKGRLMTIKGDKAKQAEVDLLSLLRPYAPQIPFAGPVSLCIGITWPWRKSEPKRNRAKGSKWHTSKPDLDNWAKTFADCMTRLNFWGDDSRVAQLLMCKRWGDRPGIEVSVSEI